MGAPGLRVGGVELGVGVPKLIVPVTAALDALILERVRDAARSPADIVEWRADHFVGHEDPGRLGELLGAVAAALGNKPLLLTIRTAAQGGCSRLDAAGYEAVVGAVAALRVADLVDVEIVHPRAAAVIAAVQAAGGLAVASYHDFVATPSLEEICDRLAAMEAAGADVCKLACMPNAPEDVATLLRATARRAAVSTKVLVTMSMGPLGAVSRIVGEAFGSSATFASLGDASAPGQLAAADTVGILAALHRVLETRIPDTPLAHRDGTSRAD